MPEAVACAVFDFDDFGAHVGELHCAKRPVQDMGQIKYAHTVESSGHTSSSKLVLKACD
jgi:hypothetical protein